MVSMVYTLGAEVATILVPGPLRVIGRGGFSGFNPIKPPSFGLGLIIHESGLHAKCSLRRLLR